MTQPAWVVVTEYGPSQGDLAAVTGYYVSCQRCGATFHFPAPLADRKDREVEKHNKCVQTQAA